MESFHKIPKLEVEGGGGRRNCDVVKVKINAIAYKIL